MDMTFKPRNFYPDELRALKSLKARKEKQRATKIKLYHFVIAGLIGTGFAYITTIIPDSFWTFIFGTIAVFAFSFIVFVPYEMYNIKKRHLEFLQGLIAYIDKQTVDTCIIHAKRIVMAEEYEDEGDLYIVEVDKEKVLYLWDYEYNLKKKFPCLNFEIYEDDFFKLLGRQIHPRSERITPLKIDKKAKWNYMRKIGAPEHLGTENKNLDKIIEEYNSFA